jgi:hypothetical protein
VIIATLFAQDFALAQTPPAANTPTPVVTTPVVIDLADQESRTIRVDAGTYRIVLMNTVVGREYWLQVGPSLPMQVAVLQLDAPAQESVRALSDSKCAVTRAAQAVARSTTEATVRKTVDQLRIALAGYDGAACTPQEISSAQEVMAATQRVVAEMPVVMTADVVRQLAISSRDGARWSVALNTTGRGVWQTTYGVAFGPNRDEEYFSEETGESEFTIRRKPADEGSLTLLPTVFFTWLSSADAFRNVQHGPTVGLGVTTGTPSGRFSVLAGWTARFNQNIGVVAGVSIYPHKRLAGQYRENQVLQEKLDSDQLNADSIRANGFLAFTLRFGSSPFAGGGEE